MGLAQMVSAASVALKVETTEGTGSSAEVPISTGSCDGLGALQFDLTYDPAIAEPESVEPGRTLSNGMVEFKVKAPGLLSVALVSSDPIDKSGELLKVRFKRVAAAGGQTALAITEEKAWDHEKNLEMLVTTEAGSLRLTPAAPLGGLLSGDKMLLALVIGGVVLVLIVVIVLAKRGRRAPAPATAPVIPTAPSQGGFCQKCGTRLEAGAGFCPSCGHAIR